MPDPFNFELMTLANLAKEAKKLNEYAHTTLTGVVIAITDLQKTVKALQERIVKLENVSVSE